MNGSQKCVGCFAPTFNTVVRALFIAELPNKKTDVNMNPRPLGFPFAEENCGYPEAGWKEREKIPYRIRVPESVDGLLVPVAASAARVAFSTIRLEPTWMAMGQAAGVAAHLAIDAGVQPRAVDVDRLQRELLKRGQVITYFKDIDQKHPAFAAMQYFGAKGFFLDYHSRPNDPRPGSRRRKHAASFAACCTKRP